MALEYNTLNKVQKIAAFLIVIGPEAAAGVMRNFENSQLELICREMAAIPMVDHAIREQLMTEFSGVVSSGIGSTVGGISFAQAALEKAKGDYAASAILNRAAPGSRTPAGEEIRQMDGRQLLNLVKSEQPQTIAFILSCLEPTKAAEVVQMLAPELREEVIERLGAMEPTSRDSIEKVAQNLTRHFDRKSAQQGVHRSGGVQACADILNSLDKVTRKEVLSVIEQKNAALGAAIRRKVFSFDDLSRLDSSDLGRVVREIDTAVITVALKGAKPALIEGVTGSMSKRAAEALMEEIEMLPQQRAKDIEAAQDKIIQVVRRLEEAEEITLDSGGSDDRAFA
jgi:flagellar motor switch protein FliG